MGDLSYWAVAADGWVNELNGSSNGGNGTGPRLQLGYATPGSDTYKMRVFIGFLKQPDSEIPDNATIIAATLFAKARSNPGGTCFSQGSAPKILWQRVSSVSWTPAENPQGGECTVSYSGAGRYPWGGSAPTATNQVGWAGTPAAGDVISVDVTDMFKDWWAARGATDNYFTVIGMPANTGLTAEDATNSNRNIAFTSRNGETPISDGGKAPYLLVEFSVSTAPDAPTLNSPASGARVTKAGTTRDLNFTYHHSSGTAGTAYDCVIATSSHVNGAGRLDTGVVHDFIDIPLAMVNGTAYTDHALYASFTPAEVRGTTYYWQIRCIAGSLPGPYSAVRSYIINRVPIPVKVRPA